MTSFVNRFILKPERQDIPKDVKRLRIAGLEFRRLMSYLEVPPAFLTSLLSQDLPPGPCNCMEMKLSGRAFSRWWYTVPVRAAIPCTDNQKSHALSTAGSNQMNPSQYLHLSASGIDIRPSKIIVYFHHNLISHSTSIICIDFQDGRWHELAEEPMKRAKETTDAAVHLKRAEHPFFMHLIIITSAARWWRSALEAFNHQLIQYVSEHEFIIYIPFSTPA